jgi:predicted transport protein
MASTPEQQAQTMIDNLPAKTGKSLSEWLEICRRSGLAKHGELVGHLKAEHGMTHGFANLVAHKWREQAEGGGTDDPVAAQYAGAKAALKPIYDALATTVAAFGKDVELAPKKTYVSLRRKKQFALIQPSTKTRVDVGINLKGAPPTDRLESSGSFTAMVSHRVRVTDPSQVDAELAAWLRQAYDAAG